MSSLLSLHRYPVKSMQGESIETATLSERGLAGDRGYAILDLETGFVASAKHPRKWPGLLGCSAVFLEEPALDGPLPPVAITTPDGTMMRSDRPDVDQALSAFFGRDVALITEAPEAPMREADRSAPETPDDAERSITREPLAPAAPAGTFFDHAPVHLITTAALERLRGVAPGSDFDACRFRPNIVVAESGDVRVEKEWPGARLRIGEIVLDIIDPAPRCIVMTLAQNTLPHDRDVLRTIAEHNSAPSHTAAPGYMLAAVAGVYASVIAGGMARVGDMLSLEPV